MFTNGKTDKGLISKIENSSHSSIAKKPPKQPNQKWAENLTDISLEKTRSWPEGTQKDVQHC